LTDVVVVGGIYREILDGDSKARRRMGGSGLVAAILASRMGASTSLASFVGEEDEVAAIATLHAGGVESAGVIVLTGASGTFVFPTDASQPWPMYRPAESIPDRIPAVPSARTYVLFGMPDFDPVAAGWLRDMPAESVLLWDRQGWLSRARDDSGALSLPATSKILLANDEETRAATGTLEPGELTVRLPPAGFRAAIVKRGREGCVVFERGAQTRVVSGFPVDTRDTIGSGDAFAGGLASAMARGLELAAAAATANAVASAFLRLGADPLAPDLPSVANRLLDKNAQLGIDSN